ncbi:MAG TPA: carboxypeptidase regulatory-like domain-containing protein [Blastocatellia bacterium]|nr:carboxypeptidase regulatory-like domain-containing protein [Blastocatellia bacterium]
MSHYQQTIKRGLSFALIFILCASIVTAQAAASLRGQVTDELGGAIAGATVTISGANNVEKTATTNDQGIFAFSGLAPGRYFLRVIAGGFALYENEAVDVAAGRREPMNIKLAATIEKQKVTVNSDDSGVNTDPDANKSALVLKGKDLDALPDDPDDLAAALQAMAGPSAGPNGGQLFIDGFSGGTMPPKEAIREIRINQNPFAAENDRIGFGRIEILTRPGVDKYHGSAQVTYNNQSFNSRNPFVDNKPDSQYRIANASFSGPLIANRASFFVNIFNRDIDDNAIVKATILDASLNPTPFSQAIVVPRRFTDPSARFDYQFGKNHTLVARYNYGNDSFKNQGIGGFSLPTRAFNITNTDHTVQLTETSILNASVVNETRFQFLRNHRNLLGDNSVPTITVLDAFTGGGSNVGRSENISDRYEIQNYTTWILRSHTFKFGVRMRGVVIDDLSSNNFGGNYVFFGGAAPTLDASNNIVRDGSGQVVPAEITSLERYRRTLLFQQLGLTPAEIALRGGGASQLSIAGGNPASGVTQWDFGWFFQDDWKARPDLTLSYGLRYEQQTNISSNLNFAPRVAFAWSPGFAPGKLPKTVIRGGAGIFYERANESLTLQASRFNGVNQQQFTVTDPAVLAVFPHVPAVGTLTAFALAQNTYRVADDLTAPYTIQSSISLERQLPYRFTLTTTYLNSRGVHYLRSRNINAPLPGTFDPRVPGSGVRPFGTDNIFEYESSGIFKQNQLIFNLLNRLNKYITITGTYVLGKTRSDADGAGSLPANTYDLRDEFGRASFDVRHRAFVFGSISLPWQVSLSPFVFIQSGGPFNITTGVDGNGDTISNERPAFATDLSRPSVKITKFGAFDLSPLPGARLIPRNFGEAPGSVTVNLRVAKTFGFGQSSQARLAAAQQAQAAKANGATQGKPAQGGPNVGGPSGGPQGATRGGPMPMGGGPPGAVMMMMGGGGSDHPYNLTISVSASNILNHVNPNPPVGNLSSPLFGQSTSIGGGGIQFGGGGPSAANNRRMDLQLMFRF